MQGPLNILSLLCAREDGFTVGEDQHRLLKRQSVCVHNLLVTRLSEGCAYQLGEHHGIDESREELGLPPGKHPLSHLETFKPDGMTKVHIRDVIPDLEVTLLDRLGDGVAEFLEHADELSTRELAVVDGLGARHDHLTGLEDESSRLGVTDTDADRRKAFWVVFSVAQMERNSLEVKLAADIGRRDNVAEGWALLQSDALLLEHPVDVFRCRFIFGNAGDVWGFEASSATRHVGSKLFLTIVAYRGEEEEACAKHR